MIYVLLDHPRLDRTDLSSLELILYGASPMSPTRLVEGLERIGPVFSQLYGQTECYPVSVLRKADHDARAARAVRFLRLSHRRVQRQPARRRQQRGEAGRGRRDLRARAARMEKYWKRPEQTAETFKGGWLHTGDIARADERGYLYIVDRKKDMIVSGGFNIFPREVEDVLSSPSRRRHGRGDRRAAREVGRGRRRPDRRKARRQPAAEALMQLVKDRKGGTHAPKQVEFVDSLPLTAVGKVDKKVLRAKYGPGRRGRWDEHGISFRSVWILFSCTRSAESSPSGSSRRVPDFRSTLHLQHVRAHFRVTLSYKSREEWCGCDRPSLRPPP